MTREEFLKYAEQEIGQTFKSAKGHLMNLVQQAWAEGKKNAEMDRVDSFCNDIFDSLKKKLEEDSPRIVIDPPQIDKIDKITIPSAVPLPYKPTTTWCENDIPAGCRYCPNHPINGGSGICHCIIGTQPIMCNSTATDICTAIENDKIVGTNLDVMTALGDGQEVKTYNAACDNHIRIIHDMMTGVKKVEDEDGKR